jgi:Transposase zinc-ribbon domain
MLAERAGAARQQMDHAREGTAFEGDRAPLVSVSEASPCKPAGSPGQRRPPKRVEITEAVTVARDEARTAAVDLEERAEAIVFHLEAAAPPQRRRAPVRSATGKKWTMGTLYPELDLLDRRSIIPLMATKKRIDRMTDAEWEKAFPNENACRAYLAKGRWPRGVTCPRCGAVGRPHSTMPWHWQCYKCARESSYRFSLITGTIFENTNRPLRDWFRVLHMLLTNRRIRVVDVQRSLGFGSYKTAWHMCDRLGRALREELDFPKWFGIAELPIHMRKREPSDITALLRARQLARGIAHRRKGRSSSAT